jgi:hypothetical protein
MQGVSKYYLQARVFLFLKRLRQMSLSTFALGCSALNLGYRAEAAFAVGALKKLENLYQLLFGACAFGHVQYLTSYF